MAETIDEKTPLTQLVDSPLVVNGQCSFRLNSITQIIKDWTHFEIANHDSKRPKGHPPLAIPWLDS